MKVKVWMTREGIELPISQMASSHLLSAIHMIERNRFTQAVDSAMREPTLDAETLPTMQYYLMWPETYPDLCAEAERRHLIQRNTKEETTKLQRTKK
jgi:hypothetical protein